MDFTPLLGVSRSLERSFLLLISEMLLAVPVIAAIATFHAIHYVDLPIFLLLLL
jgi:hypothetical protein